MHADHPQHPALRTPRGEWGPTHHRDLDASPGGTHPVQTALDLRDGGGPRPDDN